MKPRNINRAPQSTVLAAVAAVGMGCGPVDLLVCEDVGHAVAYILDESGQEGEIRAYECYYEDKDGYLDHATPKLIDGDLGVVFSEKEPSQFAKNPIFKGEATIQSMAADVLPCNETTVMADDTFAEDYVCVGWGSLDEDADAPSSAALFRKSDATWIENGDGNLVRYW